MSSHGSLGYFLSWWELENLENSSVWKHWRAFKAVRICEAKIVRIKESKGEKPSISCTCQGIVKFKGNYWEKKMLSRAVDIEGWGKEQGVRNGPGFQLGLLKGYSLGISTNQD